MNTTDTLYEKYIDSYIESNRTRQFENIAGFGTLWLSLRILNIFISTIGRSTRHFLF